MTSVTLVLAFLVNMMTGDTTYEQFASMDACKQAVNEERQNIIENARAPYFIVECAEYDVILEMAKEAT